jgi:hypothetical protein
MGVWNCREVGDGWRELVVVLGAREHCFCLLFCSVCVETEGVTWCLF